MNHKLIASVLAAATLAIGNAGATTATSSLTVQVTIVNSCTVTTPTLNFGAAVNSLIAAISVSVTGNVTCTGTSPVTVSFSTGAGTYVQRKMTNGAPFVNYNIYKEAGHINVLGDGTGATVTIPLTPSGGNVVAANDQFGIFGQTNAGQAVANGTYTDTITATVTF
jgi:spore coat protein U-like protein